MKKVWTYLLLLSLPMIFTSYTTPKKEKVKWLNLKELRLAYSQKPKPVIFDVYTDWCGWCKVMDKETYGNDKVASYINENYYAVKFNAESTESVELGAKKYAFNRSNGVHDLAVYLLFGQMGYPTTVLLPTIDARPAPISGYMKPSELEAPLKYFIEGNYKVQNYTEFMKTFSSKW